MMKAFLAGLGEENPVLVLLLGLVPAVAVATTAQNGWIIGLITATVFVIASALSSLLTPLVPDNARLPLQSLLLILLTVLSHVVLMSWQPEIVARLGIYFPLLVVNSMVLQFLQPQKNPVQAVLAALGQSLGFIAVLVVLGALREFLGQGSLFGLRLVQGTLPPLALASTVPGGLIILGLCLAVVNAIKGQGGELHD